MPTQKYRKKPVVIEAIRFENEKYVKCNVEEVMKFTEGDACLKGDVLLIDTLEGTLTVSPGDYVIKGVKGEFYPCKPDIFEQTYERVE